MRPRELARMYVTTYKRGGAISEPQLAELVAHIQMEAFDAGYEAAISDFYEPSTYEKDMAGMWPENDFPRPNYWRFMRPLLRWYPWRGMGRQEPAT